MIDLSLEQLTSVEKIRKTLLPVTQQNAANGEYSFEWLRPIVESSVDAYVLLYLNASPPNFGAFVSLDLDDHMTEARNLINEASAVRSEIFSLESQALTSALEYVQTLSSLKPEKELAELGLTATFKDSEREDFKPYGEAFELRYKNLEYGLQARFSLHNQAGGPLNYGERVSYLRDIYCDSIKNIYERLIAAKRTLLYSFNQTTDPLPNYIDTANTLDSLVRWMREAIYGFETKAQYDYSVHRTISFASLLKARGKDDAALAAYFKEFADNGFAYLDISDVDFGFDATKIRARVLGVSLNPIGWWDWIDTNGSVAVKQNTDYATRTNNESFKENILFHCELRPPEQKTGLDTTLLFESTEAQKEEEATIVDEINDLIKKGKTSVFRPKIERLIIEKDYTKPGGVQVTVVPPPQPDNHEHIAFPDKLVIGDVPAVYRAPVTNNLNFFSDNSVRNISPFGKWTVWMKTSSFPRTGEGANAKIASGAVRLDHPTLGLRDVAITFRLGLRRHTA